MTAKQLAFIVVAALAVLHVLAAPPVTAYSAQPCPVGWNYHAWDDSCNSVWPKSNRSARTQGNAASLMTFAQATDYCRSKGAELPVIRDLPTQLTYFMNLALNNSGIKWWVGVSADKRFATNQTWVTSTGRPQGFLFNWDTVRNQPNSKERCAVVHQVGNPSKRVYGGNGFMLTSDCYERHSVICSMQRVPVSITAINGGVPRQLSLIYGFPLTISIMGHRIPDGTMVSLQAGSVNTAVPVTERAPTQCKSIVSLSGVATPFLLNISNTSVAGPTLCTNGTCAVGTFTIPSNWSVVRGARYSLCFFNAWPFNAPVAFTEFEYELLGPEAYIEVFQHDPDYLVDVCTRRTQGMQVVTGDGAADDKLAPDTQPYFFDSRIESSTYQTNLDADRKPLESPIQGW